MLELRPSQTNLSDGDAFYVDVYVTNPSEQSISSVRSWLSYSPRDLEVVSIERLDSPFDLPAPGENEADSGQKLIKLGYSNLQGVNSAEILIARVNFKVDTKQKKNLGLEFYDYQETELGHTSVVVDQGGFPLNILAQKPDLLSLKLNGGPPTVATESAPISTEDPAPTSSSAEPESDPVIVEVPAPEPVNTMVTTGPLATASDLKLSTDGNKVELQWSEANDARLRGYYLYYGKTPGLYTRRKTLDQMNRFIFDNLNVGETYYFALTTYDANGNESQYTNEVAVIVGEPLSATHPLESPPLPSTQNVQNNDVLAQVPASPENGPGLNWLLLSTLGLGVVLGLGRKRTKY